MPKRRHPLGPTALAKQERIETALAMRIDGTPVNAIAKHLGVDRKTIYKYLTAATANLGVSIEEKATAYREVQAGQIEQVIEKILPLAKEGELGAVDRLVKLWARQATLLGLDLRAPDPVQQHLHVNVTPVPRDADRNIMDMVREWATGQPTTGALDAPAEVIDHEPDEHTDRLDLDYGEDA